MTSLQRSKDHNKENLDNEYGLSRKEKLEIWKKRKQEEDARASKFAVSRATSAKQTPIAAPKSDVKKKKGNSETQRSNADRSLPKASRTNNAAISSKLISKSRDYTTMVAKTDPKSVVKDVVKKPETHKRDASSKSSAKKDIKSIEDKKKKAHTKGSEKERVNPVTTKVHIPFSLN